MYNMRIYVSLYICISSFYFDLFRFRLSHGCFSIFPSYFSFFIFTLFPSPSYTCGIQRKRNHQELLDGHTHARTWIILYVSCYLIFNIYTNVPSISFDLDSIEMRSSFSNCYYYCLFFDFHCLNGSISIQFLGMCIYVWRNSHISTVLTIFNVGQVVKHSKIKIYAWIKNELSYEE